ncbi:MAG: hypothetical protein R2862_04715 [Thermoanaerobaculia bacterium]
MPSSTGVADGPPPERVLTDEFCERGLAVRPPFLLLGAILALTGRRGPAIAVLVAGFLVLLFFRDPARRFDGGDGIVLAPADGLVTAVEVVDESIGPTIPASSPSSRSSTSTCSAARSSGKVVHSELTRGLKLAAFRDDIADKNERHSNVIVRPNGDRIGVRQLAGLLSPAAWSRTSAAATTCSVASCSGSSSSARGSHPASGELSGPGEEGRSREERRDADGRGARRRSGDRG